MRSLSLLLNGFLKYISRSEITGLGRAYAPGGLLTWLLTTLYKGWGQNIFPPAKELALVLQHQPSTVFHISILYLKIMLQVQLPFFSEQFGYCFWFQVSECFHRHMSLELIWMVDPLTMGLLVCCREEWSARSEKGSSYFSRWRWVLLRYESNSQGIDCFNVACLGESQ